LQLAQLFEQQRVKQFEELRAQPFEQQRALAFEELRALPFEQRWALPFELQRRGQVRELWFEQRRQELLFGQLRALSFAQ
jgi:hypothetical protein